MSLLKFSPQFFYNNSQTRKSLNCLIQNQLFYINLPPVKTSFYSSTMTTTTNDVNNKNSTPPKGLSIEDCKALAARKAVDDNITCDCTIGIGSGSTISYALDRIKELCQEKQFKVICIPTSLQSKQLIHDHSLPISELNFHPILDVAIDGADEVDENLVAIKGGGACLYQEKVVAFAAKRLIVVADHRKDSDYLGENWTKGVPIEVGQMACETVRHRIALMFKCPIGDIQVRIGKEKAGPVITDNGNLILDWKFNSKVFGRYKSEGWKAIADQIKLIPGVVETGIFADMISQVYFGQSDGSVIRRAS